MSPATTAPPPTTIDPANAIEVRYWARRFRATEQDIEAMAFRHNGSVRLVREALGVWDSTEDVDQDAQSAKSRRKCGSEDDARRFGRAITRVLRSIVLRWPTRFLAGSRRHVPQHLDSVDLAKMRFLQTAAHDLRQPLQVIRMSMDLAAKDCA